jgi:uroporphyrinogen decarboxylase
LRDVLASLSPGCAVQGNLSPGALLGSDINLKAAVAEVLEGVPMDRHIFNLGHGITPQVDPAMVGKLVDYVRVYDSGHL